MPPTPSKAQPTPGKAPAQASFKTLAKTVARWQPPVRLDADSKKTKSAACSMEDFDPAETPFSSGDKARDKPAVEALATELDVLQNLFYEIGRAHV